MTVRVGPDRRIIARAVALVCLVAALASCARRQKVHHGVRVVDGGLRVRVASLGSCGCVTFRNRNSEEAIELTSSFNGSTIGSQVLRPNQSVRVRFDWGWPDGEDAYDVVARSTTRKAKDKAGKETNDFERVKFGDDSITIGGVIEARCDQEAYCEYGSLNMNRAAAPSVEEHEGQASHRGVRATRGNETLEVAAADERCGCVVLANETEHDVWLTATLRGTIIGGMKLNKRSTVAGKTIVDTRYVGFDSAGESTRDVYVISAAEPGGKAQAPRAGQTLSFDSQLPRAELLFKFGEGLIRVVGQMDGMACTVPVPRAKREQLEKSARTELEKLISDPATPKEMVPLIESRLPQMSAYAAGVTGVAAPEFDSVTVEQVGQPTVEALVGKLETLRADVADGARFVTPTGHSVSCPFGELNMDHVWRRAAPPEGTENDAQPTGPRTTPQKD